MTHNFRRAAVHLALAAMLLRAVMPVGWMPSAAAGSPLTICTMNGPIRMVLGPDGNPIKQKPHHEACPFAAAPPLAELAAVAPVAAPSLLPVTAETVQPDGLVLAATRHAPQSARAPPGIA